MFVNQIEIKKRAKKNLRRNYGFNAAVWSTVLGLTVILISLVFIPFIGPLFIPILTALVPSFLLVLIVGITKISLAIHKDENPSFLTLFSVFRKFFRNVGGQLWKVFCSGLWGFLFLLPANIFLIFALNSENEIVNEIPWLSLSWEILPEYNDYFLSLSGMLIVYVILLLLGLLALAIKNLTYSMVPYLLVETQKLPISKMIKISKKMTHASLWNLTLFFFSFLGWGILVILTGGLLGLFWVGPYFQLSLSEIYLDLKELALQSGECKETDFL